MSLWLIIIVSFVVLFLLLFVITLNRYISYKERVALAQLGFSLEDLHRDAETKYGNRGVLWGGVITAMSGLALLLGLATLGTGAWLLAGLLPLFVGLGMVLIYFLTLGPAPRRGNRSRRTGKSAGSVSGDEDSMGEPFAATAEAAQAEVEEKGRTASLDSA